MSDPRTRAAASVVVAAATAVVLVALAILPFLNPVWVAFEQDRAEAVAWTGFTREELRTATDALLADLVVGPPAFDVVVRGDPVLNERERAHLADVRAVLLGLAAVAAAGALALVALGRANRGADWFWRAVRAGAAGLVAGVALLGLVALVAFDAAFEVFHRLLFAGGTYTFDPRTERLVQLFPWRFWFETSIAVGGVILVLAAATAWLASRRLRGAGRSAVVVARPGLEATP